MTDDLFAKVREEGRSIRTLTVRVRCNDMAEDQLSESLNEPTDLETDVDGWLHQVLQSAWKRRVSLRLISLKLFNVYGGRFRCELPLEADARRQNAQARLAGVIDDLRKSRGHYVILRGHDEDGVKILSRSSGRGQVRVWDAARIRRAAGFRTRAACTTFRRGKYAA